MATYSIGPCGCCARYPVRVYRCGGIYYTTGTYASLEVAAYDVTNTLVYSWKSCNNGTTSGSIIFGSACNFVLVGVFNSALDPPITITIGDANGSISNTVSTLDLNFNGVPWFNGPYCTSFPNSAAYCPAPASPPSP